MIINTTKKLPVAVSNKKCETFLSQSLGLMFRTTPKTLLFVFSSPRIVRLHMMFVFFPIDIILLDEKKKVVEVKHHLKPFSTFASCKKAKYCIEGEVGIIRKARVQVGDSLSIS